MFKTRDGADILISIQNDREWRVLADKVLGDASLGTAEKFATVPARQQHRGETDATVAAVFARYDVEPLMKMLASADIAFARVNDSALLSRIRICGASPSIRRPARRRCRRRRHAGRAMSAHYGAIPSLGEHSDMIRKEFGGN